MKHVLYTLLLAILLAACQPATAVPRPFIDLTAVSVSTLELQTIEPTETAVPPTMVSITFDPPRVCDDTAQPLTIQTGEVYSGNIVIDVILQNEEVARLLSATPGAHVIAGGTLSNETLGAVHEGVGVTLYPMVDAQCTLDYIVSRMNAGAQLSTWVGLTRPAHGLTEPFVTFIKQ